MPTIDEIELIFAPIADAVQSFANQNSLAVEKCVRGNSGWELTSPHKEGGTVHLLLLYDQSLGLGIGSVWQFPCEEMSLIYSHFRPVSASKMNPDDVTSALSGEYQAINKVRFGYWTHLQPMHHHSNGN